MTTLLTRHPSSIWNDPFFDRLLGTHFTSPSDARSFVPKFDIVSNDNEVKVFADLPGSSKEDLDITLHEFVLTVKGSRSAQDYKDESTGHLRERRFGSFSRSIRLPKDIDTEAIQADMKNGVLTLTIAKKEETKPKRIQLK